ncbi:MAG: hypothetical protein DHS20C21_10550 [Gemmatimonadota bacterium]|nr:MAG: hypothetical protein DHS20C21_10550 [Gemmatimonadota bacterium]
MLAFFRTFLAVIAAVLFLTIGPVLLLIGVAFLGNSGPQDDSWLTVRLSGSLLEYYGPVTMTDLVDHPPTCLMEITENLEKAAADDRIRGVIFRVEPFGAGLGKLDEIRAGIQRVREAGKPVYAHAVELTDPGLYVASACDSTFLFPDGALYLLGRGVTMQHMKGTLDLLDVRPQFHAIDEYKSAHEMFTRKHASPEALENLTNLVEDLDRAYDGVITDARQLAPEALAACREQAIFRGMAAVEANLVDDLLTWDELSDRLRGPHDHLRTISSPEYGDVERRSLGLAGKTKVAVIHAQGFVTTAGDDRYDPVMGLAMGVDRVIDDLEEARSDSHVKAILLRLDTPGGATEGGLRLARAVARARDEKPVIVSVADVSTSAGYMMSAPANQIICPGSGITGSIGSIIGKFNVRGLYEKFGFTFDELAFSPNAFLFSELHDWTPEQRERIEEAHWAMYNDWIEEIARRRGLTPEEVHESARGQVWTGRQALERDLVDGLGGFEEALQIVRQQADLEEDSRLTLEHFPRDQTLMDVLLSGDLTRFAFQDILRAGWASLSTGRWGHSGLSWEPRRVN